MMQLLLTSGTIALMITFVASLKKESSKKESR